MSLAIWIGGVADELLRLVNAGRSLSAGDPNLDNEYSEVCREFNLTPVVDVITGASAGGLNGVFLALALVRQHPKLTPLRDLWIEHGAFEPLLRDPIDAKVPSLMRGDEYFLQRLEEAIDKLFGGTPRALGKEPPMRVRLTATSLEGHRIAIPDRAGNVLHDIDHYAEFRFEEDDFAPQLESAANAKKRLARACRTTASFPGAFEPSQDVWPGFGPKLVPLQGANHLVDGGVLANLPASQVIDAIAAQPSSGQVKRVLALVVPDPGVPKASDGGEPKVGDVVAASLMGMPRVQSLHGFLERLREHNERVRRRGAARRALLTRNAEPGLLVAADVLFRPYRAQLREKTIADTYVAVSRALGLASADATARKVAETSGSVPQVTRRAGAGTDGRTVEWIDGILQSLGDDIRTTLSGAPIPFLPQTLDVGEGSGWCWHIDTIRRLATIVIDFANGARSAMTPEAFIAIKERIGDVLTRITDGPRESGTSEPVDGEVREQLLAADFGELVARRLLQITERQPTTREAIRQAIDLWPDLDRFDGIGWLNDELLALGDVLRQLAEASTRPVEDPTVRAVLRLVGESDSGADAARILLALEVVEVSFAGSDTRSEQTIDLIQITSQAHAPIDPDEHRQGADAKLAGEQLGHFGAFLKRSWRANDWMWGRLDAATRIVRLMADVRRELDGADAPVSSEQIETLTRRVQQRILREELPEVEKQIAEDEREGSPAGREARAFQRAVIEAGLSTTWSDEQTRELLRAERIGWERITDELGSDLATRTTVKALATGSTVMSRNGPKLLRVPVKALRSVSLFTWFLVRLTRNPLNSISAVVGLILGLGIAGAVVDAFTTVNLGVLGYVSWLAVLAVAFLAMIRAPLIALPLLVLAVIPGVLAQLPEQPEWWPDMGVPWPDIPDPVAGAALVTGLAILATMRRFPWLDRQIEASKSELAALRHLQIRVQPEESSSLPPTRRDVAPKPPSMGWLWALIAVTTVIVTAKNVVIAVWPGSIGGEGTFVLVLRNGVALVVVAIVVLAVVKKPSGPRAAEELAWFGALGLPRSKDSKAWLLAALAIALAGAGGLLAEQRWPSIALLVFGSVPVIWLLVWTKHGRADDIAWTVVPGWLVVVVIAAIRVGRGGPEVDGLALAGVAVGTGLFEELIFRGGLQSLGLRARTWYVRLLVPGLAFGCWHIWDAVGDFREHSTWLWQFDTLFVAGTILATALASWLVLEPLRLRSRSVLGPALLHAAVNCGALALGAKAVLG